MCNTVAGVCPHPMTRWVQCHKKERQFDSSDNQLDFSQDVLFLPTVFLSQCQYFTREAPVYLVGIGHHSHYISLISHTSCTLGNTPEIEIAVQRFGQVATFLFLNGVLHDGYNQNDKLPTLACINYISMVAQNYIRIMMI